MADKIKNTQNKQNEELTRLSEQFRKRRRQIIETGEEQTQKLQKNYKEKEKDIRRTGEASVNHIRKQSVQKLDTEKSRGLDHLARQRQVNSRQYENLKTQGDQQKKGMERTLVQKRQQFEEQVKDAKRNKDVAVKNEYKRTDELQSREADRRKNIVQQYNQDIKKLSGETKKAEVQIRDNHKKETHSIINQHRKEQKHIRENQSRTLAQQRRIGSERMKSLKAEDQMQFESERIRHNHALRDLKDTKNHEYNEQHKQADFKIRQLKGKNQKMQKEEISFGARQKEKIRNEYDNEITRIHKDGDTKVHDEKLKYEKKLREQDKHYKVQHKEQQDFHSQTIKNRSEGHQKKIAENEELYKKDYKNQRNQFDKAFTENDRLNRASLQGQRERMVRSLGNEKREIMQSFGKYNEKTRDPFYRLQNFNSSVTEHENFFEIKAHVPEHEKNNVDFIIKDEKVILNGNREFKDTIDAKGHRVLTNKFQTFREEIPLRVPVKPKAAMRKYEDGVLTVKIPKLKWG